VLVLGSLGALAACQSADDSGGGDAPTRQALRCMPGESRVCPCVGAGMGSQLCNPAGTFDPCTGCPPPALQPATGGSGALAGMTATAPVVPDAGPTGSGGAAAASDSGTAASDGGGSLLPDDVGNGPGTSCGEALPALCELSTEKCCGRSLRTDTCIPAAEACTCDLPDCTTMEASCDGPEDCITGQVCCGTFATTSAGGAAYTSFTCTATCSFNANQREACHEGKTTCPMSLVCANSQLLSNVQVCIDAASIEQ
jgi:hypothetical protein